MNETAQLLDTSRFCYGFLGAKTLRNHRETGFWPLNGSESCFDADLTAFVV